MDLWQIGRLLGDRLAAATWGDTPNDPVLTGGAFVCEDGAGNFLQVLPDEDDDGADADTDGFPIWEKPGSSGLPFAKVQVQGGVTDEDPQRFDEVRARITVYVGGFTDMDVHGEAAIVGGARDGTNGQGKSTGRAVDEVLGRILENALNGGSLIDSTHGIQAFVIATSPINRVEGPEVVSRSIELVITNATVSRTYHTVRSFTATGGAGQVALAWSLPPSRFDRLRVIVRRAAGSTAPATPSSGTGVTLSGDLATSVTVSGLSAGTHTFSVFVAYDETHDPPSTEERYSEAVSLSATVT